MCWRKAKARRRLRRAGEEVLGGRQQQGQGRRSRLLRPRARWCRSSTGRVRDAARPDQRSGQDAVRLPHHQGGRQEAGDQATLDEVRAQIEDQLKYERAQDEAQRIVDDARRQAEEAGRPRHGRQGARAAPSASPASSPQTSRSPASAWRRPSPQRAFELKDGEVSDAIRTPQGFAFITVTGKQDAARSRSSTR